MSEIAGLGALFMGIGMLIVCIVIAVLISQLTRNCRADADYNERFGIFQCALLDQIAEKKGINLQKEMIKYDYMPKRKDIKQKIEEEIMNELFNKVEVKKEK